MKIGEKFPVSRLRKFYQENLVRYKKIKLRRAWRKKDDVSKIEKDNKVLFDLK